MLEGSTSFRHGPNLEHLDTDWLKQHWIAADGLGLAIAAKKREFDDAASELGLRGLVPEELIPREIAAAMQAEEIAASGKPEAAEFKKLAKDVNKACGL